MPQRELCPAGDGDVLNGRALRAPEEESARCGPAAALEGFSPAGEASLEAPFEATRDAAGHLSSLEHLRGALSVGEVAAADITPNFTRAVGGASLCGGAMGTKGARPPRVAVLVVEEGLIDKVTWPVFQDAAEVTAQGLRNLGADAQVARCRDLRSCKLSPQSHDDFSPGAAAGGSAGRSPDPGPHGYFVVVLGVHHLARYMVHWATG